MRIFYPSNWYLLKLLGCLSQEEEQKVVWFNGIPIYQLWESTSTYITRHSPSGTNLIEKFIGFFYNTLGNLSRGHRKLMLSTARTLHESSIEVYRTTIDILKKEGLR